MKCFGKLENKGKNMLNHIGLFNPHMGHDACGVGFIAKINAEPGHDLVLQADRKSVV